jgi:hypothetical protein
MAQPETSGLSQVVLDFLRQAGEPVREAILYERVAGLAKPPPSAERFLAAVSHLVAEGRVRIDVEHELEVDDPAPFEPRYYRNLD